MADYATLLRDHITLTCRSIDRIFLQAYVPKLQSVGQVCLFLNRQRGYPIPSSAAFGQIGEAYVAAVHRWAEANGVPIRYFAKGDNKEKIAEPLLRAAAAAGGDGKVVLIGIAQEKASAWRSWKKKGQEKAKAPTHGVGPPDGFRQPLLFLSVGSRVGRGLLEDQRLCSLPDLAVAECPQLGTTPVGESRHPVRSARQLFSLVRQSGSSPAHLQPIECQCRAHLLLALVPPSALAVYG